MGLNINKLTTNQYLNLTLNIWIHRISDITTKRISIKPLSAGRYLLISCYKVQCFYDMFAKICFTWFCLLFVEVANKSFWGSNIGKYTYNLWQMNDISSFVSFDYLHIYCNARCIHLICKYLSIKSFIVSKVHCYSKCTVYIIFNLFPYKDVFHFKAIFIQYIVT